MLYTGRNGGVHNLAATPEVCSVYLPLISWELLVIRCIDFLFYSLTLVRSCGYAGVWCSWQSLEAVVYAVCLQNVARFSSCSRNVFAPRCTTCCVLLYCFRLLLSGRSRTSRSGIAARCNGKGAVQRQKHTTPFSG